MRLRLLRHWKRILFVLAVVAIGIQLVPVARTNPAGRGEPEAPPEIKSVLRRACYDCHSNETRWPWYAYVAPVSWLVGSDVTEGRQELNFSEWTALSPGRQAKRKKRIGREVTAGEMPPWYYVTMHPAARLSPQDLQVLASWTAEESVK
jgi:hypothetical protein